jgi:NTE family protein
MHAPLTALVLSGGGARGAYEAGVVAGLIDVLGHAHFDLIAGTSVGAINAAYLASHSQKPDFQIGELLELWTHLSIRAHLRPTRHPFRDRSFLNVDPFVQVVKEGVDWTSLASNIDSSKLKGLFIAALEVESGRTAVFADLSPDSTFSPSSDPRRFPVRTRIQTDHVLASAAIPGVFPPRQIGHGVFYDGGLRFNTPIAPVLRAGAGRLVVVSPLFGGAHRLPATEARHVDTLFLAGKMLHAVLLDPFAYDLEVLERFNHLLEVVDSTFDPEARAAFNARCVQLRGAPYRRIDALVLSPSRDIGQIGLDYIRANSRRFLRQGFGGFVLGALGPRLANSGTDLASYLLFDGGFTQQLIALGRSDVAGRADEVRAFFARAETTEPAPTRLFSPR